MAKAKKTESTQAKKSEPTPAPKAAVKAKAKAPAGKGGASGGSHSINTDLAAQTAARMLLARAAGGTGGAAGMAGAGGINQTTGKKETSTFKNLKENLAKPHLASMDNVLNSTGGNANLPKSNQPFNQGNQKGHNQTYGADVNRAGVPRRTPG